MKKITRLPYVLFVGLFVICLINNQSWANTKGKPKLVFKAQNNQIQLDTMYLNDMEDEVELEIEFENKGTQPLIVKKVTGCCGTQITDWTKKPLSQGEKGTIKIHFRVPLRPHKISRTVKAISNDPEGVKTLKIEGILTERDDGSIQLK